MMKWMNFLSRKQAGKQETASLSKWQLRIIDKQRQCADWLQFQSQKLSPFCKRTVFLSFLLVSSCLSTYLVFRSSDQEKSLLKVSRITLPASPEHLNNNEFLSIEEYHRLSSFRSYMDSLARSPTGSDQYLLFSKQHPGLLDSIRTLEQLYDLQIKNKKNGKETHR